MKFPEFNLPDQNGRVRSLEEFRDRLYLVIYFYPRDNTPGCTLEAKEFTGRLDEFHRLGAEVIGISTQTPESHIKFCADHDLKHILLSDGDKRLVKDLGIQSGLTRMAKRTTYLITPVGEIIHVWRNVGAAGHAEEVLRYLKTSTSR